MGEIREEVDGRWKSEVEIPTKETQRRMKGEVAKHTKRPPGVGKRSSSGGRLAYDGHEGKH